MYRLVLAQSCFNKAEKASATRPLLPITLSLFNYPSSTHLDTHHRNELVRNQQLYQIRNVRETLRNHDNISIAT